MHLGDRLFAFWRLPEWRDPVQVLLWSLGWLLTAVSAFFAMSMWRSFVQFFSSPLSGEGLWGLFPLVIISIFVGWFVAGCWFVSEAYGGWRAGHPHGRGWVFVISGLILMNTVPTFWMDQHMEGVGLAIRAAALAFAVALLVASFTTRMPTRRPPTTA